MNRLVTTFAATLAAASITAGTAAAAVQNPQLYKRQATGPTLVRGGAFHGGAFHGGAVHGAVHGSLVHGGRYVFWLNRRTA